VVRRGAGRGWLAALAVAVALVGGPRAVAEELPTSPLLVPVVRFWVDVFTRWSVRDVVLHDRIQPEIVYAVLRGPVPREEVVRRVAALEARVGPGRVRAQRGLRETIADGLVASRLYAPVVEAALARERLPPALAALPLLESSYHPWIRSRAGAVGLWQLTEATARQYALRVGGGVDERRDPRRATLAAARLLRDLRRALPTWPLALTAYNRGLSAVQRARRAGGTDDLGVLVRRQGGPGLGFAARNFYAELLAAVRVMRDRDAYFPELAPVRVVEYRVRAGDTLAGVARRHGVSPRLLQAKNGLQSETLHPGQRLLIRQSAAGPAVGRGAVPAG
jgi:membrane-bound lytic murein transglycosylase D